MGLQRGRFFIVRAALGAFSPLFSGVSVRPPGGLCYSSRLIGMKRGLTNASVWRRIVSMFSGRYEHQAIEKKWQEFWLENATFRSETGGGKPKY